MIKGFAHTALYTTKFKETINFYKEIFDAKEMGYFKTKTDACWLSVGDDILEIFNEESLGDGAFKHIAIECDNVDNLFEKALKCGAAPHVYPKDIVLALNEKVEARIAFIKGINGEQIELFERK